MKGKQIKIYSQVQIGQQLRRCEKHTIASKKEYVNA